ncbi:inward rectifier potassium channel [Aureococcus anophagefferens]|uniref:Inward rectifier potassium channel n=1 Tax=Aureococcus anophagefferens TaxID=44056 RepID=A0ABR1FYX2_AURAN
MGDAGREGARSSSTESRRSKKNSHVAIEMAKTTSERLLKLSPSSSRAKGRRGLFSGPRTRFLSPGEPGQYAGGGNFGVGIREQNPMRGARGASSRTASSAVYYSLITMSTIGFGTPDMTFNGCTQAIFLIMAQTLVGTLMNAALVGLIYTKLFDRSSSSTNDQLIEAHVRCYCIRHVTGGDDVPVFFQQCAMRLSHPNDENGGMLMMALPTLVTHRIDPWSPLCPPKKQKREGRHGVPALPRRPQPHDGHGLPRHRAPPGRLRLRRAVLHPLREVCGGTRETEEQLERHRVMSAIDDRYSGHDVRCASYQSGEVFQSYRSLRKYCKENDMDVPRKPDTGQQKRAKFPTSKAPISAVFHSPDTHALEDRRRHSRLNHLKYLPDIVLEDDLISLTESESSSSSSDDGEARTGGDAEEAARENPLLGAAAGRAAAAAGVRLRRRRRGARRRDAPPRRRLVERRRRRRGDQGRGRERRPRRRAAAAAPPPDDAGGERRRSSIHDVFPPHDDHHPALKPSESGLLSPQRSSRLARDVDRWRDLPQVEDHLSLAECEIVVIVEAIDTYTSSTMQARHSYSFNDGDVLVNRTFVPCVEKDPQGKCLIDLKKFHETRDCDGSKNSYFSVPSIV